MLRINSRLAALAGTVALITACGVEAPDIDEIYEADTLAGPGGTPGTGGSDSEEELRNNCYYLRLGSGYLDAARLQRRRAPQLVTLQAYENGDPSQKWCFRRVGGLGSAFRIQQGSFDGRYLQAESDHLVTIRDWTNTDNQLWLVNSIGDNEAISLKHETGFLGQGGASNSVAILWPEVTYLELLPAD